MASSELVQSWAITLRHLAVCRYYLPEQLLDEEALAAERELAHYLHHNELGMALREAEALGDICEAPPQFWRELQLAAQNMGHTEAVLKYSSRTGS